MGFYGGRRIVTSEQEVGGGDRILIVTEDLDANPHRIVLKRSTVEALIDAKQAALDARYGEMADADPNL